MPRAIRLPLIVACWLIVGSLEAAVIKGRVLDSAGRPVVGAEIRIWRKTKAPDGTGRNEPVTFGGAETLRTDDAGQFATDDLFDANVPVRVVVQADGTAILDPRWAVDLFNSLPEPPDLASHRPQNQARMLLARFLVYPYKKRLLCLNYLEPE